MLANGFIKNYDKDCDTGYLLKVDIDYPKELHESHKDLPFLSIKNEKLLTTLQSKEKYVVHIATLKQALLHGLELKKLHRVISLNQEAWLKPYIDKNTELTKMLKMILKNDFKISLN